MLEDIEKINRLAENLKKTGLAANMSDAFEIAKRIVTKGQHEKEEKSARLEVSRDSLAYNVAKEEKTVKELLEEEAKNDVEEADQVEERKPLRIEDIDEAKDEEE